MKSHAVLLRLKILKFAISYNNDDNPNYLIFIYCGFSPGAADSDSFFKLITWLIDKTVAATNHGIPSSELIPIVIATINRSKW
jgi:hypothetical protein